MAWRQRWRRRSRDAEAREPGYLEAVYHLFSVEKKHGPVVLRMRTENRADQVELPSLTPVWRSAEFQEREVFDLFGIVFDGHPDLRRILMWDEFKDHPMRRITWSRTILSMSRRRTMRCWSGRRQTRSGQGHERRRTRMSRRSTELGGWR